MPTVFVTGANRGLGLEFVRQYAADGWEVLATCRDPDRADALRGLASESKEGRVEVVTLDVADDGQADRLTGRLGDRPIDLVINNAGVYGGDRQELPDLDFEGWLRTLSVNTLGPLRVVRALLPNVRAGRGRKIVALTSGMGSIANNTSGGYYAYRTSKAALNAAFKSLSIDLRDDGIAVAVVSPGWVRTDMGGPNARLSPAESVADLRRVVEGLDLAGSGGFYSYDGSPLPW
jgi:NAD(P)-dependent dehydrogenase (short-subunit alcohol dehydrogenase family)